jgi:hypothetical protein
MIKAFALRLPAALIVCCRLSRPSASCPLLACDPPFCLSASALPWPGCFYHCTRFLVPAGALDREQHERHNARRDRHGWAVVNMRLCSPSFHACDAAIATGAVCSALLAALQQQRPPHLPPPPRQTQPDTNTLHRYRESQRALPPSAATLSPTPRSMRCKGAVHLRTPVPPRRRGVCRADAAGRPAVQAGRHRGGSQAHRCSLLQRRR